MIDVVAAAWLGWGAIFTGWLLHAYAAPQRSIGYRRLARVPVWIGVALIETAVCLTGLPVAWGLLLLAAAAACAPALAATIAPTPLPWVLAAIVLVAAWISLPSADVGLVPAVAAALLFASPYRAGTMSLLAARAAGLIYFGGAPLACFAAIGDRRDLTLAFAAATTTHVADIAAGLSGKLGGWRPLSRLSPGKTLAGFTGALLGGCMAGWLTYGYGAGIPTSRAVVLGAGIAVLGAIGDLAASKLKRLAGVKDFGTRLGPHGGVSDRLDSLVLVMAALPWVFTWARPR